MRGSDFRVSKHASIICLAEKREDEFGILRVLEQIGTPAHKTPEFAFFLRSLKKTNSAL
jgi:hypothetical protein